MNKNKTNYQNKEKNSLKTVIYDKKCQDNPYFDELKQSLKDKGIHVSDGDEAEKSEESLYICATEETADEAKKRDAAFVCYGVKDRKAQCEIEGFDEVDADFIIKMYQRKHDMPWDICETERLSIREFALWDSVDIFEEKADEPDYNELYIRNIYGFFGYGIWAVISKDSGNLIGKAGIMNSEKTEGIELGYEIFEEYRNRGYATEACRAVLRKAEAYYGINEVYAFTYNENLASKRVLEKLGFTKCSYENTDNIEKYVLKFVDNALLRV